MLGTDKARRYCLEMICADFLAGANLDNDDPTVLLQSMSRFFKFLPGEQRQAFLHATPRWLEMPRLWEQLESGDSNGLEQESGQMFSDGIVQAPVLLTHCHPVALRNLVNVHGYLHHRLIQRAENVQEFVNIVRSEAVLAQLSPLRFLRRGHRIPSRVKLCDLLPT
jgi:hypothetical protein